MSDISESKWMARSLNLENHEEVGKGLLVGNKDAACDGLRGGVCPWSIKGSYSSSRWHVPRAIALRLGTSYCGLLAALGLGRDRAWTRFRPA